MQQEIEDFERECQNIEQEDEDELLQLFGPPPDEVSVDRACSRSSTRKRLEYLPSPEPVRPPASKRRRPAQPQDIAESLPERSWLSLRRQPQSGLFFSIKSPHNGSDRTEHVLFLDRLTPEQHRISIKQQLYTAATQNGALLQTPLTNLHAILHAEETERRVLKEAMEGGHDVYDGDGLERFNVDATAAELWVNKYAPSSYSDLLSDSRINRQVLQWVRAWDPQVFRSAPTAAVLEARKLHDEPEKKPIASIFTSPTAPTKGKKFKSSLPENPALVWAPDQKPRDFRPYPRILLLTGSAGTGKTTLAHLVASHCNYNVVEINASDDRSAARLRQKVKAATEMKSVFTDRKPNLVVIDEIDGAMGSEQNDAVRELLKIVNAESKRASELKRPIICICNDLYAKALRPLRQHALVYRFLPPKQQGLCARLHFICANEGVTISASVLRNLVDRCKQDMRSCIHALQFLHRSGRRITQADINALPPSEACKDRFEVWRKIFRGVQSRIARARDPSLFTGESDVIEAVSAFSDARPIIDGVFENYLIMPYSDPTLENTVFAAGWFSFSDLLESRIMSLQDFSLGAYTAFVCVAIHVCCGVRDVPRLNLPRSAYEQRQTLQRKRSIVHDFHVSSNCRFSIAECVQDVIPLLGRILLPKLRSANFHLMKEAELVTLNTLIDRMLACGLTYVRDTASLGMRLEPPIEQLTTFTGVPLHFQLPQPYFERIAVEVNLERIRRGVKALPTAQDRTKQDSTIQRSLHEKKKSEMKATATSTGTKAQSKGARSEADGWKACFQKGRGGAAAAPKKLHYKMHFRYHEGITDAIRRPTTIHQFF